MIAGHEIAIALRAAYLALHRRSDARFAPFGITADQFVLLATLDRSKQPLMQRELARRMSSDPSTVRAMLVLLERHGLVERESHPTDARARTVALTKKGERTQRRLWKAGASIRAEMLGALESNEAASLVELLMRVAGALTAESGALRASTHVSASESTSCPSPEDEP
jgi:DNA-binding MarR family transcriptional regulator